MTFLFGENRHFLVGVDRPTVGGAVGVIGMISSDSKHTYLHPDGTTAKAHAFCSSLHFEPVKELKLNIVFREKRVPDIEVQIF